GDCARRSSLIAAPSDRACGTIPNGPKRYISAKPLARFVPELTKKAFQKHGFSSAALVADWDLVVGHPLAHQCTPERLKWPRATGRESDGSNAAPTGATLVLRTDGAHALDIEYASAQIIERINAYFGYRAITTLKIVQGAVQDVTPQSEPRRVVDQPAPRSATPSLERGDCALSQIDDERLRAALERMHAGVLAT
nr:DciA family protein [Alphaproteobacteria bacterium]